MTRKLFFIFLVILSLPSRKGYSQDTTEAAPPVISLTGYIKDLQMVVEDPFNTGYLYANQIHNRLNFSYFPNDKFTAKVEARNRFFTGSLVTDIPGFEDFLDTDNGITDLSYAASVGNNSVISLQLDRAWVGYRHGKWDFTLGRQRINWGLNNVWNPNDVFNAYNFFEFDYEERPGSDAVRVQYATGGFSFVEAVAAKGNEADDVTYAMLYRFNTHGYDIQLLGGSVKKQPVAGIGWAGNILDAGFKTEVTWYGESGDSNQDSKIILSSGLDYTFDPGWYVNVGYLYNSGFTAINSSAGISYTVAAADPFPYEHAALLQLAKEISPIWMANFTTVYSADNNIVLLPSISYSPATNWEVLLYGQYFKSFDDADIRNADVFLRLKWSFAK